MPYRFGFRSSATARRLSRGTLGTAPGDFHLLYACPMYRKLPPVKREMKTPAWAWKTRIVLFAVLLAGGTALVAFGAGSFGDPRSIKFDGSTKAPEFTHAAPDEWINSAPLRLAELRGKVVLIDFWTFDCWNCYRSFPWLKEVETTYHDRGLRVIGVHTPEFEHERVRKSVEKKAAEFGLDHPVMIDNDFSYWRAMNNRYWPTFYLIDKRGFLRSIFIGETRSNSVRAGKIEAAIEKLLSET